MEDSFDYSACSLEDLLDAQRHIDRNAYPDRAAEIDHWIRQRTTERDAARAAAPPPFAYSPVAPSRSKTTSVLAGCGVAAAVAAAALLSLFVVLGLRSCSQGQGSQEAARKIVDEVTATWTPEPVIANASQAFRKSVTADDTAALFALYRKLGTRTSLGEPTGGAKSSIGFGNYPTGVTAQYQFPATFSSGPATINITLVREDDAWKVYQFSVNSKALFR
jgi:hypothetical protein